MGLRERLEGTWFDKVMTGIGQVADKGFRAAAPALDMTAHVAKAPARAVTAAGHEVAGEEGGGWGGDPLDYVMYGFDPETGRAPAGYGQLLGESIESETNLPPAAADAARLLADLISDPVVLASGVSAARGLPGGGAPPTPRPVGMAAQGQVYPQYAPAGSMAPPPGVLPAGGGATGRSAAAALAPPATGGAGGVGGIPFTHLYRWFRG